MAITDYMPYPPISGDRIRVYNLLRRVARSHEVALVGFLQKEEDADGTANLRGFCASVEAVNLPERSRPARLFGMARNMWRGTPLDFEFLQSGVLASKIRALASANEFDIVQIEHSRMAPYLESLPERMRARNLLSFHNVAFRQYDRISRAETAPVRRLRAKIHARMLREWEPGYAERFDRCTAVSSIDRDCLMRANPRLRVDVVPNGVDTDGLKPLPIDDSNRGLIFVGTMSYAPCADGAVWFCNKILPLIRRAVAGVEVWIVGQSPAPEVERLDGDGVHVTGRVADVVPYYRRSALSVCPIRAGGGTRLKILEAMALGRPVVSTSVGCEGLDVVDGEHLLVADEAEAFARRVIRLLLDRGLARRVANEGRMLVASKYDWDMIAESLLRIYSEM